MADQNEEYVNMLVEICGVDGDAARRYLRAKNNNVEAAITAFFDGEDISQAENSLTWNEADFSAGRDGPVYGPQQAAFNDGGNSNNNNNKDSLYPLGASNAPTRGNSPAPSLRNPTSKAEEDDDMQRALANSRSQAQETGIIHSGSNAAFGPATRDDYYDPSKWAMTIAEPNDIHKSSEIVPDAEPAERQWQKGEPRFLKHLPAATYLPQFLTIAHSIPMARNALLLPSHTQPSYGQDSEWWRGHTIRMPTIVSTIDGSPADPASSKDEVVAEMQRLMAFLDCSTRAYASVDPLLELDLIKNSSNDVSGDSSVDKVLRAWEQAANAKPGEAHTDVFHTLVGTSDPAGCTPDMWTVPLDVSVDGEGDSVTLSEAIDGLLWSLDGSAENYVERFAPVLPIRLLAAGSTSKTGLVAPATICLDKYLRENLDLTRSIRQDMAKLKDRMQKIDLIEEKLRSFSSPSQPIPIAAELLLDHAIGHFSGRNQQTLMEDRIASGAGAVDLPPPPAHHKDVAEQLQAVLDDVKAKLDSFKEEKEKSKKMLSQLSQMTPPDLPEENLRHRYTLRGVATKPNVTYLLLPRAEDASTDPLDVDVDAPEGMHWWRIEYQVNTSGATISKAPWEQETVIQAIQLEHTEALLVYATEEACTELPIALAPALQQFIRDDDEHFQSELLAHTTDEYPGNGAFTYSSIQSNQRRPSTDSTVVQYDDEPSNPPPYDYADTVPITLGDRKDELMDLDSSFHPASPPAHDIQLDDNDAMVEGAGDGEQEGGAKEMVEKPHEPLAAIGQTHVRGLRERRSDDTMADVPGQGL